MAFIERKATAVEGRRQLLLTFAEPSLTNSPAGDGKIRLPRLSGRPQARPGISSGSKGYQRRAAWCSLYALLGTAPEGYVSPPPFPSPAGPGAFARGFVVEWKFLIAGHARRREAKWNKITENRRGITRKDANAICSRVFDTRQIRHDKIIPPRDKRRSETSPRVLTLRKYGEMSYTHRFPFNVRVRDADCIKQATIADALALQVNCRGYSATFRVTAVVRKFTSCHNAHYAPLSWRQYVVG